MNSKSAKLQISYNTQYNVSITATLCGLGNTTMTVTLHFGESGDALLIDIRIEDYFVQLNAFILANYQ